MAASMKRIKTRIKSVESTRQITKAMELVATSKLRRAKERVERARPYHDVLADAIAGLQAGVAEFPTVYTEAREVKKTCYVVIGGDRGLAGGYNSNVLKLAASAHAGDAEKPKIIAIGRKSIEYFTKRGYEVVASYAGIAEHIKPNQAQDIADLAIGLFRNGEVDEVQIFFTMFNSSISQVEQQMAVLPMETVKLDNYGTMNYDPSPEAVFNRIVPKFTASLVQCAIVESFASEQGARRTAMESATDNADAMTENLSLLYNRARQASITQEITEIVSGANALE